MTLADLPCLWLTTLRPDGSPHTTPVWFVWEEATVWVASSATNIKVRNIRQDARVSMAFDSTSRQPAVAEGHAIARDLPGADAAIHRPVLDRLAEKYDGWDAADASWDGPRVLIEIAIDRWLLRESRD